METLLIDMNWRPKKKLGRPRKTTSLSIGDVCLDLSLTSTQRTLAPPTSITSKHKSIKGQAIEMDTNNDGESSGGTDVGEERERQCLECNRRHTPLWRRGPKGTGTLCNACGVKWNKQLKQQHVATNSIPVNDAAREGISTGSAVNVEHAPECEAKEGPSNNVGREEPSLTIVESIVRGQMIEQKPRSTTFIAPLKKRKVILD